MSSLQFAAKRVCTSSLNAMYCLPDHRGLDSDQQYHFAKVHDFCNYHKVEAIIVFYFAKPNVALQRPFFGQFGV